MRDLMKINMTTLKSDMEKFHENNFIKTKYLLKYIII